MAMAGHGRTVHFHTKIDGGTGRRSQLLHEYNHLSMMLSSPNPLETVTTTQIWKGKKVYEHLQQILILRSNYRIRRVCVKVVLVQIPFIFPLSQ